MKERKNIDAQMASAENLMAAAEKFNSNPQENEMLISSAENLSIRFSTTSLRLIVDFLMLLSI